MPPSPAKPLAEIRSTPEEAAASSSSRPAETAAEARSLRRGLALAAAVALVWTLLLAAHFMRGPLFLVDPPITRCEWAAAGAGRQCMRSLKRSHGGGGQLSVPGPPTAKLGAALSARSRACRRTSGFFELHGDSCSYKLGQGNWTDTFRAVK